MKNYIKTIIIMIFIVLSFYLIDSRYFMEIDYDIISIHQKSNGEETPEYVTPDYIPNLKSPFSVYDYPHPLIIKNQKLCPENQKLSLVFLVKSYIKNFSARMAIRETWGLDDPLDIKTRHVFLMGVDYKNDSVRIETMAENDKFNDIILADYQDEYDNNSIKDIMGFNWARKYCSNSKFYILADDDAYISVKNLVKYLKLNVKYSKENQAVQTYPLLYQTQDDLIPKMKDKYIGGYVHIGTPIRKGQWSVTHEEYPYDKYPPFPNGHCVIISRTALDDLIEAAKYTKFFKLDDVYFGFLAAYAGLEISKIPEIYNRQVNVSESVKYDKVISSHYIKPKELRYIYAVQKKKGNA